MRNKGFTITEIMVTLAIGIGLMSIVFGIFIVLNTSLAKNSAIVMLKQGNEISMETTQRYLEKSRPETITISECGAEDDCYGDKIEFKVPVINTDAISGTVFHPDFSPKMGSRHKSGVFTINREGGYHVLYVGDDPESESGCRAVIIETFKDTSAGSCFLAGTPILLSDGSTKPIEKIEAGDEVLAYNEETGETQKDKVTKLLTHEDVKGYLIINGSLKVTPEHRFYSEGKWIEIGSLKVGDKLLDYTGQTQEITSIEEVKGTFTVYNFKVEPSHTYFAGGFLVHNAKEFGSDMDGLGKLFFNIFKIKEAYADIVSVNKTIIATNADNMSIVGYPSNANPKMAEITITFSNACTEEEIEEFMLTLEVVFRN